MDLNRRHKKTRTRRAFCLCVATHNTFGTECCEKEPPATWQGKARTLLLAPLESGFTQVHPVPAPSGAYTYAVLIVHTISRTGGSHLTLANAKQQKTRTRRAFCCLVSPSGFEPLTCPLGGGCAIQLCQGDMRGILPEIPKI